MQPPQQRLAIPLANQHKGLLNRKGENNCFLNVAIQTLWHVNAFRYELQNLFKNLKSDKDNLDSSWVKVSLHTDESTVTANLNPSDKEKLILPTLGKLFHDYEFSDISVLPPTKLREVLYNISSEFELGAFADSNEALEVMLEQLHMEHKSKCVVSSESIGTSADNSKCISHSVFGMSLMKQITCNKCLATSEPTTHFDYMQTIYASQVINIGNSVNVLSKDASDLSSNFSAIVRKCLEVQPMECPSICDSKGNKIRGRTCSGHGIVDEYCLEMSSCIAIAVAWESDNETRDTISAFLSLVSYSIDVNEIFSGNYKMNRNADTSYIDNTIYVFRGLICYYGHHYVSIFQEYSPGEPVFLLFDDQHIRKIGNWDDVKTECIKAHYQPVTLLYEIERFVDIDVTSNASVGSPSQTPVTNIVPKILLENQNRRTTLTALEDEINNLTKNVNSSLHIKKSPTIVTRKNVASDENRSNSSNDMFRIRLPDGFSYWQSHNTYLPPQLTRTKSIKYSKPMNRHYF